MKKHDIYFYLKAGLLLLFLVQTVMLAVFNLTQMQYHMGYDASSFYLKAMEIAKQGTLFLKNWVDQTTLYFDSAVPFAALLYRITGNIFVSYGIVNLVVDLGIFYVFYSILKSMSVSDLSKLVCLNMIACSYLSPGFNNANDIGYFSSVLSSDGAYGLKMLIILMVIKMMFDMEDGNANNLYIFITEALLFVSGVSSGWYLIVTVLAPLLVYYILRMLIHNSFREMRNTRALWLMISILVVMAGKMAAVHIIGFESKDSHMVLTGLTVFWKNLGAIVLGFMQLVGAFPLKADQPALEIRGLLYLAGVIVFLVCMTGAVYAVRRWFQDMKRTDRYSMLICIAGFNLLMFTVLCTTYGSEIFETRYLIPLFFIFVIMAGSFVDSLDNRLIFKYVGVAFLFAVLLLLNVADSHIFLNTKNNYQTLVSLTEKAKALEASVVYVCGNDIGIDARNLRVVDGARVYKFIDEGSLNSAAYWGDYTYYKDAGSVQGKNVLITTEQYLDVIPEYIKNKYILEDRIDKYLVYSAETAVFDLESGISGDYSIDYPTSSGISVSGGIIEEDTGSFISDEAAEGLAVWGPYAKAPAGRYKFIMNYEILKSTGQTAELVISLEAGNRTLATVPLKQDGKKAVVDIEIDKDSDGLEYKVYDHAGTVLRVDSFEIMKETYTKP